MKKTFSTLEEVALDKENIALKIENKALRTENRVLNDNLNKTEKELMQLKAKYDSICGKIKINASDNRKSQGEMFLMKDILNKLFK